MVRTSACWVLAAFATGISAQTATSAASSTVPGATSSVPAVPPVVLAQTTTTYTPWDSSGSSSGDVAFLQSSNSDSLHDPTSSGSDPSGSAASSGSTAFGSSGSYLELWQWGALIALCCCCAGGCMGALTNGFFSCAGFLMGKKKTVKKPKKPSTKKPQPVPKQEPAPAPAPVAEPQAELLLPPIMPMPTASPLMPSYSMAAPVTYAATPEYTYAAPAAAFPATTSYAATPQYAYAQPAYAQPEVLAAPGYNYAAVPAATYASQFPAATYASQFPSPAM